MTAALGSGLIVSAVAIACLRAAVWILTLMDLALQSYAVIEIGFYFGTLAVVVWAVVGVFRTAWRVQGKQGLYLGIFSGVCLAALAPVGLRTAISAKELGLLAIGRDPLGEPVTIRRDGPIVVLEGMFSLGSAKKFAKFASQLRDGELLVLSSPGGRITEADKIAAIIRDRQFKTHVDEECSSACTMVMLAGRHRSADVGARIGFHQPTQDGNNAIEDRLSAVPLREFYLAANVDGDFIKKALSVASDELWYPDTEVLRRAGVIDRVTITYRLSSLTRFFEAENSWDLDKDFAIVGATTDGTSLELLYKMKPKSRFRGPSENVERAAEQLVRNSCSDEDFAAVMGQGARLVLRPVTGPLPTLFIALRDCPNA